MKKFTLLELLVVVAIIGVLISILMPSLKNAREEAYAAVCKSNMSNSFKSVFLYTTEWNGTAPPHRIRHFYGTNKDVFWNSNEFAGKFGGNDHRAVNSIEGRSIYRCPKREAAGNKEGTIAYNARVFPLMNMENFQNRYLKITTLIDPAMLCILVDGQASGRFSPGWGTVEVNYTYDEQHSWSSSDKFESPFNWTRRHNYGGTNVGYADGHVSFSRNLQTDWRAGKVKVLNE